MFGQIDKILIATFLMKYCMNQEKDIRTRDFRGLWSVIIGDENIAVTFVLGLVIMYPWFMYTNRW